MITSVIGVKNFESDKSPSKSPDKSLTKEPPESTLPRGVPDPKTSSVVDEFTKRRSERTGA